MSEVQTPAPEAGDEVVTTSQETETPEAAKTTEGQETNQPAEPEGDPPEGEEKPSPAKARRERRKQEMDRLREESREHEAENAKLKQRLAEYERRAAEPAPQEADFEDPYEYQAALAAHKSMQALDGREKERLEAEAAESQRKIDDLTAQGQEEAAQNWAAQVTEAQERYSDFDAVVNAPDLHITKDMAGIIASSDMGADIAYHLGTNKAEAAQIASLPPIEQAMALGRIEATVSLPKPRTQTEAPEPITPVRGKASPGEKDPDDMSMAEYKAWRAKGGGQ